MLINNNIVMANSFLFYYFLDLEWKLLGMDFGRLSENMFCRIEE